MNRCIVFFICAIAACVHAELKRADVKRDGDGPQGGPDSEKIIVVKTWDELRARPSIDLGNGIKVRLGVSALSAPRYGTVLLYCLADGYEQHWMSPDAEAQLGPVQFNIRRPDVDPGLEQLKAERQDELKQPSGRLLFAQFVFIDRQGKYEIAISDQKNRKIASCTVEGSKDTAHAWSPFGPPEELKKFSDIELAEAFLTYDGSGIAAPQLNGRSAIRWESSDGRGPQPFDGKDPLPSLETELVVPSPVASELKSRIEALVSRLGNDDFQTRDNATRELAAIGKPALWLLPELAKASTDIEVRARIKSVLNNFGSGFVVQRVERGFLISMRTAFQTTLPEEVFLARWWVNGKPFTPSEEEKGLAVEFSGHVNAATALLMHVKLDAAKLGAKSGDKIGLQLLYCPSGFQRMREKMLGLAMPEDDSDKFPIMSNKIEFNAP